MFGFLKATSGCCWPEYEYISDKLIMTDANVIQVIQLGSGFLISLERDTKTIYDTATTASITWLLVGPVSKLQLHGRQANSSAAVWMDS